MALNLEEQDITFGYDQWGTGRTMTTVADNVLAAVVEIVLDDVIVCTEEGGAVS